MSGAFHILLPKGQNVSAPRPHFANRGCGDSKALEEHVGRKSKDVSVLAALNVGVDKPLFGAKLDGLLNKQDGHDAGPFDAARALGETPFTDISFINEKQQDRAPSAPHIPEHRRARAGGEQIPRPILSSPLSMRSW